MPHRFTPTQSVQVYEASQFCVSEGVKQGDNITCHQNLILGDQYMLQPNALRGRLSLETQENGTFRLAEDTSLGQPGAALHLDCALTFMSPDGSTQEAVVMVELDDAGQVAALYLLSLSGLQPRIAYTLLGIDADGAHATLTRVACVYFARGTHIALSTGEQRRIEHLRVGDRILTRNDGAQEIRWIGSSTIRARGDMTPVRINAGALNNERDLIVSPDHRLFVNHGEHAIGAGQADLMVKARHLVNGDTVHVAGAGFIDYFQILFDRHHIIYAEGIAAESMLADPRTKPQLPPELLDRLSDVMPEDACSGHHGLDVQEALLERPDAIDILRRASLR